MHPLIKSKPKEKVLLLGNEAIVRGALEAGLRVGAAYPGTPSSEIGNNLFRIQYELPGLYFEFSTNEKVATEVAAAAAAAGLRSLTCMKHVGLNVAADALMTLAYIGVRGGMVIVVADDPSCHSSQNEQDSRYYARLSGLPLLEPATPQEAYEMTIYAFDLSEKLELPVILRTTTRVSHARGIVQVGELASYDQEVKGEFKKDPRRWVPIPAVARVRHQVLLEKMKDATLIADSSRLNYQYGKGKQGIITSSVAANYVYDIVEEFDLKDQVKVLVLGFTHPHPVNLLADFLRSVEDVLVVEELEPYLEEAARVVAQERGLSVNIMGKATGHLPRTFEFEPKIVKKAMADAFGISFPEGEKIDVSWVPELPPRPPTLCPGCPHRETYMVIKETLKELGELENSIFPTDIGCYTLGILPPIQMADYLICMGSSVGSPCGFSVATNHRIVSFIGDSTFFHAGLSPLANAVFNKHNFTLVIMDNETTAMTGHQPVPSQELRFKELADRPRIDIEAVVKALGVKNVVTINPYRKEEAKALVKPLLGKKELSVIIAKAPCILYRQRVAKK